MSLKPRVGISSCLLGRPVRYNGGHKRHDWLVDELGKWVIWVPVCPEMEMGLGAPRESMSLVADPAYRHPRLIANKSRRDLTALAVKTSRRLIDSLGELDGYVLKKNSPSCGLERVKRYGLKGAPIGTGPGLFAERLRRQFPELALIEEGRLTNPEDREHFVTRLFASLALRAVVPRVSAIQKFHEHYKLLLMAHSPTHYRELGRIAAGSAGRSADEVLRAYGSHFKAALSMPTSTKKRVNVLQHVFGYFSPELSAKERTSLLGAMEKYRLGELSFLAALTLIEHTLSQHPVPYLEGQLFFEPYPKALALRRYL